MNNEWIAEVLSDLASFAECNGLPKSYESLLDAMVVVSGEIYEQRLIHELRNTSGSAIRSNVTGLQSLRQN